MLALLQPELLKVFPAAFLGRVSVIPYLPLTTSSLQQIVRIHLYRIAQRAKSNDNITLTFSDELVQHVVDQCPVAETGARMLIRFIEKNILPEISHTVLNLAVAAATEKTAVAMHVALSPENKPEVVMLADALSAV